MMGFKLKRVDVKLEANEEKELNLVLEHEKRAAIHGTVRFPEGTPVKNAVVKLFRKKGCGESCELIPITFAFTDECGQFLFGVNSGIDLAIKVFFYKPEHKVCDTKEEADG